MVSESAEAFGLVVDYRVPGLIVGGGYRQLQLVGGLFHQTAAVDAEVHQIQEQDVLARPEVEGLDRHELIVLVFKVSVELYQFFQI